ncbi:hypothetical protein P3G55_24865, partial [Leptospira sp. 96542]|nr:hypothetical protein [Leptospira sp. 96542]
MISSMKFSAKLLVCALVPAALFILGLIGSIGGLVYTKNQFGGYIETEQRVSGGLKEMYAQGLQMGQALRNIVLDPGNARGYENLDAARKAYDKAYGDTTTAARDTPFALGLAKLPTLRSAHAQAQEQVLALVKEQSPETVKFLNATETPAWRNLRGELLKQIEVAGQAAGEAQVQVEHRANQMVWLALSMSVLAVLVSVVFTVYLRNIVKNELGGDLGVAREALTEIAHGNLAHAVPGSGHPNSLMQGLARMQTALRQLVGAVREASGRPRRSTCRSMVLHGSSAGPRRSDAARTRPAARPGRLRATTRWGRGRAGGGEVGAWMGCEEDVARRSCTSTKSKQAMSKGKNHFKAGILTSLGFGHIGVLCLFLHRNFFWLHLSREEREDY